MDQPVLNSSRLVLRPFTISDAKRVQSLAGDKLIAAMTAAIPHPYPDGLAESWIGSHIGDWNERKSAAFAITVRETQLLIGATGYVAIREDEAEFGYWIGVPYWGNGYSTLNFSKQFARHLPENEASARVIVKNGLHYIGDVTAPLRGHNRVLKHYELSAKEYFAKHP